MATWILSFSTNLTKKKNLFKENEPVQQVFDKYKNKPYENRFSGNQTRLVFVFLFLDRRCHHPLVTAKPAPPPGPFLLTVSRSILAVRFDFSSLLIFILVRLYRFVSGSGACRTLSLLSLQSFFGGINHVIAVRFLNFLVFWV